MLYIARVKKAQAPFMKDLGPLLTLAAHHYNVFGKS